MTTTTRKPFGILGIGAAACVACCAGPILGLVVATGVLTATGLAVLGTVGLLIAIPGVALITARRSRVRNETSPSEAVTVAAPARRV